jgi:hypothetical protein
MDDHRFSIDTFDDDRLPIYAVHEHRLRLIDTIDDDGSRSAVTGGGKCGSRSRAQGAPEDGARPTVHLRSHESADSTPQRPAQDSVRGEVIRRRRGQGSRNTQQQRNDSVLHVLPIPHGI